jgi:hypothetical protein
MHACTPQTNDPLAVTYNDQSPLENHHVSADWVVSHSFTQNSVYGLPVFAGGGMR